MRLRAASAVLIVASGVFVLLPNAVRTTSAMWVDSASNGSNKFTTTQVSRPALLSATPGCSPSGKVRVILEWSAPSTGATPDGYDIYRSKTTTSNYAFIAHVADGSTTTYTDGGVQHSLTYWYRLRSTRGGWSSTYSNELSALTPDLCF
ncbi:MAG TPA: hypothetical protein VM600_09615 [Actinomycetota bacterium]|nr:hypothetical protein [Actinomycetota bacterium]